MLVIAIVYTSEFYTGCSLLKRKQKFRCLSYIPRDFLDKIKDGQIFRQKDKLLAKYIFYKFAPGNGRKSF